jgi:hypothetical protein
VHTVAIEDVYNTGDLTFVSATTAPSSTVPGSVTWNGLTVAPGATLTL